MTLHRWPPPANDLIQKKITIVNYNYCIFTGEAMKKAIYCTLFQFTVYILFLL